MTDTDTSTYQVRISAAAHAALRRRYAETGEALGAIATEAILAYLEGEEQEQAGEPCE